MLCKYHFLKNLTLGYAEIILYEFELRFLVSLRSLVNPIFLDHVYQPSSIYVNTHMVGTFCLAKTILNDVHELIFKMFQHIAFYYRISVSLETDGIAIWPLLNILIIE
jgi:hypothetical protein